MGTLFGPLYGAIAFFALEESLPPLLDLGRKGWGEYWQIVFGPMLVLIALYASGGIDSPVRSAAMAEPLLRPTAWSSASAALSPPTRLARRPAGRDPCPDRPQRRRQDHADRPAHRQAAARLPARIRFAGRDVTRLPTHARARLGLARSFQITSVLREFTALDNVALAVQAHAGHSFRFLARCAPRRRACASRRAQRSPRSASPRAPTARRRAQPWRAAPARDRHGAGRRAQPAAARRADGRHGPRGIAAHDRLLRELQGPARACC